jgi:hypothetical protein
MTLALNILGAMCLLAGVYGCTETMLMLAAVPAETSARYDLAVADAWWAAAVAVGGFAIGSLALFLAHCLAKPRRIVQGVQ